MVHSTWYFRKLGIDFLTYRSYSLINLKKKLESHSEPVSSPTLQLFDLNRTINNDLESEG